MDLWMRARGGDGVSVGEKLLMEGRRVCRRLDGRKVDVVKTLYAFATEIEPCVPEVCVSMGIPVKNVVQPVESIFRVTTVYFANKRR